MAQKSIQVRIDEKLKKQAEELFASLGLDLPTAIRIYFVQAVLTGGIPFAVTEQREERYTKRQLAYIAKLADEAREGKNLSPAFTSADELIKALRS